MVKEIKKPKLKSSSPKDVKDIVRRLSVCSSDGLATLACYAIDSASGGSETYVDIDFLKYRPQITYIDSKSALGRLAIAEEIIGYLKTLSQTSSQKLS